jgi:hypothetical protein
VDKILLALLVALTGSLLLSPMRLVRIIMPMRARQAPVGRETISEVKERVDHVPLTPSPGGGKLEFRALTEEQKKEFEDWRAKYKQMPARNPSSLARGSPVWPSAWTATPRAMRATGNPVSRPLARRAGL